MLTKCYQNIYQKIFFKKSQEKKFEISQKKFKIVLMDFLNLKFQKKSKENVIGIFIKKIAIKKN